MTDTDKAGMLADKMQASIDECELCAQAQSAGAILFHPFALDHNDAALIIAALRSPSYEAGVRRDAERLDAIDSGEIVISGSALDCWRARKSNANGFITENWNVSPSLRQAIDAALLDSGRGEGQKRG